MKVTNEELRELLRSEEYQPHLLHDTSGGIFIDMRTIPKDNYLPVNGDYCLGFSFCNRINESQIAGGLVNVEVEDMGVKE